MTNHASDQEFTLDHGFETPEPFDRSIANLDMRCTANSVGNGMSLMVTASFGSDYVEIDLSDGGKLEVKCEIQKAMIVAKPYKCEFTDLDLEEIRGGFSYKQEFSAKRSRSQIAQTSFEGGVGAQISAAEGAGASAKGSGKKSSSSGMEDMYCTEGSREFNQVQFGIDQITIHGNPDGAPLEGNLVDRVTCFRVVPHASNQPYGVLMQLLVRRGGMKLADPEPLKISERLQSVWTRVFGGSGRLDKFHREAFQLLLQHLIETGLQDETNTKDAVLAARAIRAVPIDEGGSVLRHLALTQKPITLPVSTVESVLSDEPEKVVQILNEIGVDAGELNLSGRKMAFVLEETDEESERTSSGRHYELDVELQNYCSADLLFQANDEGAPEGTDSIFVNGRVMRQFTDRFRKLTRGANRARYSDSLNVDVEIGSDYLKFVFFKKVGEVEGVFAEVGELQLSGKWIEAVDGVVRRSTELMLSMPRKRPREVGE